MNDEIKKILRSSGYPDRAEFEWIEFEKAYQREVRAELPNNEWLGHLAKLFGRSFYLTSYLIKHPDLAKRFFQTDFLTKPKSYDRFIEELSAIVEPISSDIAATERALRHYRYEETLRYTVRDIAGLGDFVELGYERSNLAAACIEVAYQVINEKLRSEYGLPVDEEDNQESRFSVLGMGKLGGGDLNYSSDIDLIYLYSSDKGGFDLEGAEHDLSHHQYFVRLGEMLAKVLSDRTQDGFVYRVDLDLRPEGIKGTLANSIEAMEVYYESFGDNWERMALTKARPVAGDQALGMDLLQRVRPFIYPRTSDYTTVEQVHDLKNRIEQSLDARIVGEVNPQRPGYNVKLGIGGIREIEFIVGAFQRLYGGREKEIQDRHTLTVLSKLADKELMSEKDAQSLAMAYQFLRSVENRLQMLEDRQTHSLPKNKEELEAFVCNLQYDTEGDNQLSMDRFYENISIHTEQVRRSFESLLKK